MAIMVSQQSSGSNFKQVPPGSYVGRCYSVIDMGTHKSEFQGKPKELRKVRLSWEIPDEPITLEDGTTRPSSISATYTLSLHEKSNLRKLCASWRGRDFTPEELQGFDISKLINAPGIINVTEYETDDGKSHSSVAGVGKLGKNMQCPELANKPFEYSVTEGRNEKFRTLPEWLQKKIMECLEWKPQTQPAPAPAAPQAPAPSPEEDDVPF